MDPIIGAVLKKTYNNDKNSDREINYVNMNNKPDTFTTMAGRL